MSDDLGVPASPSGHQPTASAAGASSQSGVPNAGIDLKAHGADYIYDASHWECTYDADMLSELSEEVDLDWSNTPRRFGCLKKLPDLWLINVPTEITDDGDPDDFDTLCYLTEAEAKAAYDSALAKLRDASAIDVATASEPACGLDPQGESAVAKPDAQSHPQPQVRPASLFNVVTRIHAHWMQHEEAFRHDRGMATIVEAANHQDAIMGEVDELVRAAHAVLNLPNKTITTPDLEASNARLVEALRRIEQWCAAYPIDIFPEPDLPAVTSLLRERDMLNQMDRMHSSWARHVTEGIGKIVRQAIVDQEGK